MRLKVRLIILLSLLFPSGVTTVGVSCSGLSPQRPETKGQQDDAGPYVVTNADIISGSASKKMAEVRTFLWEHWSKRKLGHLQLTLFSKEGVATNTTYEIEPDEHGTWSLKVSLDRPSLKGTTSEHSEYRTYTVRRTASTHDQQSPVTLIPETEIRTGDAYRLVFYDEKDKKVGVV